MLSNAADVNACSVRENERVRLWNALPEFGLSDVVVSSADQLYELEIADGLAGSV